MDRDKMLEQVNKVIILLDSRLRDDPNRPILNTLYYRYSKAKERLTNNEDINKIMINGGCRAYLDTFSDYRNPLLFEMDKAEKMMLELKTDVCGK